MEPSDVVLALDASGSITQKNFKKVVDFAKKIVIDLPVDTKIRVGLETFSDKEEVRLTFQCASNVSVTCR